MSGATGRQPQAEQRVQVIAAVVEREGRYLLGRRPSHKRHGGLWEFPGGKVDQGETVLAAARRELLEELDVVVRRVGRRLLAVADPGSSYVIDFRGVSVEGEPTPLEHEELGWFLPAEMLELELAPADARMARHLAR